MNLVYRYKKVYKKNKCEKNILRKLIFSPIDTYFFVNEKILPTNFSIMITFRRIFGFFPDLKNPKTLNEKPQWKNL